MGDSFNITIPAGYWLEGLSQVRPELTWRAYLRTHTKPRTPDLGTFRGAVGRTPQEAIDLAQAGIEESLKKQAEQLVLSKNTKPRETFLTVDDLDF